MVVLIDARVVIERILHHLGQWEGVRLNQAKAPPAEGRIIELLPSDPFPDYGTVSVMDYDLSANACAFASGTVFPERISFTLPLSVPAHSGQHRMSRKPP